MEDSTTIFPPVWRPTVDQYDSEAINSKSALYYPKRSPHFGRYLNDQQTFFNQSANIF
jgi:hypothetical protein